ncbi:carboxylesterase/lipase family protein [Micromonospora sp. CB01531]|uniref:carboxylesterase/lipase family protein n=1 Tax=Micromonospora sp. CB01531 TaxID=1718947 RepID=UPI00130115D8|nr:carboxylesterase family protein [Micromonospora sp. CB01531]
MNIDGGAVHGAAAPGGYAFRGLPYAAAPTGQLRWRAPQPPASWKGVREAADFGPSCPQPRPEQGNVFFPPGPIDEDCLYLNVSTPTLRPDARRPVLVWIHGGGLTQDASRNYDGTKLAADGTVVVTMNYRLGALGFLAHPALASRPGGPAGNYGLMDQRAALRWVQRNISRFGGDPYNVTIAGQSAGGLSVLAHLVSRGSRGLFQRAIVQSGAFALTQQPLATAKAAGEAFADLAGCPDQTAACLRSRSVDDLVNNFPGAAIPGVVDGAVLEESIGTALAGGRFARVPILNGTNHDEERLFLAIGLAVSGGSFALVPEAVTADNYQRLIGAVVGASPERSAAIAAEYPLSAYPSPGVAFSTLVSDANFVCPAVQLDRWTSARVPTFAYEFNDDTAPQVFAPPGWVAAVATHSSELQYLFDLPNAPFAVPLNADQAALAAAMRAAWASFAADGNPSTRDVRWPALDPRQGERVLSLASPRPQVDTGFAARHHCSFWAAA